jgi:hypothetical protein
MLPEEFWRFLQRWLWLLAAAAIAGAALGTLFLPRVLSGGGGYTSTAVLSVARFASPSGVTAATNNADERAVLQDYTQVLADGVKTAPFLSKVGQKMAARGTPMSVASINDKLQVEATPSLFRIALRGRDSDRQRAEALVATTLETLQEQVRNEEQNLRQALATSADQRQAQILERLRDNQQRQLQRLQQLDATTLQAAAAATAGAGATTAGANRQFLIQVARLSGDPELMLLSAETEALAQALSQLASARETVEATLNTSPDPFVTLRPLETVQEQPLNTLRARDALVLGAGVGLVVGWLSASVAEQLLNRRRNHRLEDSSAGRRAWRARS